MSYEFGPSTYFSIIVICLLTLMLVLFERQKRKALSLIDQGYYFVETFVTMRRTQMVPVPPDNVDASDPNCPRIINPALVQRNMYGCCT